MLGWGRESRTRDELDNTVCSPRKSTWQWQQELRGTTSLNLTIGRYQSWGLLTESKCSKASNVWDGIAREKKVCFWNKYDWIILW